MPQGKMSSSRRPPPGNRPYVRDIPKPIYTPIPSQSRTLFRTMAEGFAFGTGSSVAREVIHNTSNVLNSSSANTTLNSSSDSISKQTKSECEKWEKLFEECIEKEQSYCIHLFEKMEKWCSFQK